MAHPGLTLDQLAVLDAIDRYGTFGAAAERLHRATSAVSYAVKTLEATLGIELFDRSGQRARLTPWGTVVLNEGRELLARSQRLVDLVKQLRAGWEPELQVVADGVLPIRPLLAALQRLHEQAVPTQVRLIVEHLTGVRERFERDRADLMLAVDFAGQRGLLAQPLPPVPMVLVARHDHPVHRADGRLDRKALTRHVEVLVADSATKPPPQPNRFVLGGRRALQLPDFQAKREALLAGVGFGWLPEHLAAPHLTSGELRPVPFAEGSRQTLVAHLIHRQDVHLGRGAEFFIAQLLAAMGVAVPAPEGSDEPDR